MRPVRSDQLDQKSRREVLSAFGTTFEERQPSVGTSTLSQNMNSSYVYAGMPKWCFCARSLDFLAQTSRSFSSYILVGDKHITEIGTVKYLSSCRNLATFEGGKLL